MRSLFFYAILFYILFLFLLLSILFLFFRGGFYVRFIIFDILGIRLRLDFVLDYVSLGFFMCVSLISSLVFFYRNFYMREGRDLRRFYFLVFLFVISMLLLVFSGNFFLVIVGWDGLGLVSFCLVIFYSNKSVLESGLITVFRNRVGDVFFLITFFLFYLYGSYEMGIGFLNMSVFFSLLIFFGAITKRAQVPFSAWLPAAIAAPTPVSSLVHSSTLVTAGLYVIIRFNYLFYFIEVSVFCIFCLFTMILAGGSATVEVDFKKVVAMSTLSQLGLILFTISIGYWILGLLHIIIHAFFKRILFLSTGGLISQVRGGQDSRIFGRRVFRIISFFCFTIRRACLSGFPFFIGFYSKDCILRMRFFGGGFRIYLLFLFGCMLTVWYRIRIVGLSFFSYMKSLIFITLQENYFFFCFVLFLSSLC